MDEVEVGEGLIASETSLLGLSMATFFLFLWVGLCPHFLFSRDTGHTGSGSIPCFNLITSSKTLSPNSDPS